MMKYEIVVVGGGPAAITLAKRLGKKKELAIIRPEDHSMIYCAMPYVIEGLLSVEKTLKSDSLVTDAGATLIRDRVERVDYAHKCLYTRKGETIAYDRLILATGAEPVIPQVPGVDLLGVYAFKSEEDLTHLSSLVDQGLSRAVVVGAGAIGIELAQALRSRGIEVSLIDMASHVLSNLIDGSMALQAEQQLETLGVDLILEKRVVELRGSDRVETVFLDDGTVVELGEQGIIVFAVGMRANTELVDHELITTGPQGIIVNEKMESTLDEVYAVGDCTQFISGITSIATPGKLATNAVPMAKVLSDRLLGIDRTYPGFFNGAATKIGELFFGGTGISELAAERAGLKPVVGKSVVMTQFPIMPDAGQLSISLVCDADSRRLIGGQVVSVSPVTTIIDLLTFAIQKESVIEDLIALSYSSQPYQSFYPAANGVVLAAEQVFHALR